MQVSNTSKIIEEESILFDRPNVNGICDYVCVKFITVKIS